MIVRLATDGALVSQADGSPQLHLETDLDAQAARTALVATGIGRLIDDHSAWLDLGVLRSRAQLAASGGDWAQQWAAVVEHASAEGVLSADGRAVRVRLERV